jgi:hypothetical protein
MVKNAYKRKAASNGPLKHKLYLINYRKYLKIYEFYNTLIQN